MASFTSASQHYQDYRDYPMVVHPSVLEPNGEHANPAEIEMEGALDDLLKSYITLVDDLGVLPEEARQVLPNASAVNILVTMNARSLENFFYQRLCRRNVSEMRIVAEKMYRRCLEWWPEFFTNIGPACYRDTCNQGKMTCGKIWRGVGIDDDDREACTYCGKFKHDLDCPVYTENEDSTVYCSCTAPTPTGALNICSTCALPVGGM